MISHALTIVQNEFTNHLDDVYGSNTEPRVILGNLAEGFVNDTTKTGVLRNVLVLSVVNIKEEKALKNVPNAVRDDIKLRVSYVNAPVFVNFYILVTATHVDYTSALTALSRAIRFFQYRNVFTQDNVDPDSITTASVNIPAADRLDSFKLIFELYSPSMEEVNHLWGTLGGKQYPFVMYVLRMLDLRYYAVQSEGGLITNVIKEFRHKDPLAT